MDSEILIVGGGLAGLAVADMLERQGRAWHLLEAQDRLGGRILSHQVAGAAFDLGPAWFWPGQPRIQAMIDRFGLSVFEQFSTGMRVFQDQTGAVHPNRGFASMQGSLRLRGGMASLVDAIVAGLPQDKIALGAAVSHIELTSNGLTATAASQTITAKRVVLALPPRIAADTLSFSPSLPETAITAMRAIPTWMAGHAKIVAIYDRPHWRDAGFSGDAMSQVGPMVEIHDASPDQGGPYAIFGFVGYPAKVRADHPDQIVALAKEQLIALFGPSMGEAVDIFMQDWALVPQVATSQDWISPSAHPAYGLPDTLSDIWSGQLMLGSTETGPHFGGFLEGALEAAEAVIRRL
jgi:monoamine oxidase